jgi:hypothetical protein
MTGPTEVRERRELVVTRAELLALGAVARGESPAAAGEALAARGLLGPDGRTAGAVAPTAGAVGSPLATVRVTAVGAQGTRAADVWVGGSRAVLHPGGDAAAPVVSVSRALLPQLVVRATGLGPRPVAAAPAFAAEGAAVAAACRGTSAPPWAEAVERPSLWRLSWRIAGGGVEGGTGDLAVLDLGPLGYWRPAPGENTTLTWSPVRSALVWRALGPLFAATLEDRPAS